MGGRPALLAAALIAASTAPRRADALPQETTHGVLRAVPIPGGPGSVVIDGVLDGTEWDVTARMHVYPARKIRRRYSVDVHAMWDADALYLGMHYSDPTPMINNVDAEGAPFDGWQADGFQARFVTDWPQIHMDAWYSSKKDMTVGALSYERPLNRDGMQLFRGKGTRVADPGGFALAFRMDTDRRGYVEEMRIPWRLLYRNVPEIRGGLTFRFTGEYFWGGPTGIKWPAVLWSDPINPENPVRIVVYQNPHIWGKLTLLSEGNLPEAERERVDEGDEEEKLQGPIPVRVEVPADAVRFTVAIDDAGGRRVRNLVSHAEVKTYAVGPPAGARRELEVLWDGRADGGWDKERRLFLGDHVPPGEYTVRVLVHGGVGVVHAGSFMNPGAPPWPTSDGKGSWLSDHAPPHAVAAMARGAKTKGRAFLVAHISEAGVPFIGLDGEGRKMWQWLRQTASLYEVAADERHCYFAFSYVGKPYLGRADPDSGQQVKFKDGRLDVPVDGKVTGLAAAGGRLAVAIEGRPEVLVLDADLCERRGAGAIEVDGAHHLAFAPDGALVGISRDRLFRADVVTGRVLTFAVAGVAKPAAVTCDGEGRLYVSDAATSTVKVYDRVAPGAGLVGAVGRPGGRRAGPFDPACMATPRSLAVEERPDGAKRLWCVEDGNSPRRVVVWDVSREEPDLVRDYVGGTGYNGTGGLLSDDVPDMGIHGGVVYEIDYEGYDYRPVEVMGGRPDPHAGDEGEGQRIALFAPGAFAQGAYFGNGYHFISDASGREVEYYVEGGSLPMVFVRRGKRWHCVAALGHRDSGVRFPEGFPQPTDAKTVFSWSDLDGDGYQTAEEVTWADVGHPRAFRSRAWGYRCDRTLSWYHTGVSVRPARFAGDGAPVYDLARAERLPGEIGRRFEAGDSCDVYKTGFGYVINARRRGYVDPHRTVHGFIQLEGYDGEGRLRWTYPAYWHSVHGAMTAPMAMPGVIMGVLKISGVVRMDGFDVIALRGNTGQEFLVRDDGLYVGELFTDQRMAPAALPAEERIAGVPVNDTSLGGEPFSGWISRQLDGKVRMTYGSTDVRIAEVTGLDTIRALPASTLVLTEDDAAKARRFVPERLGPKRTTGHRIARGGAFDPKQASFGDDALVIRAGREEVAKALLRHDDEKLHVAWLVYDMTPLVNRGEAPRLAFKSGDCVSVFVAPGGDCDRNAIGGARVLLTRLRGKDTAVVYRPTGPGEAPFTFESPVRKRRFTYVRVEPEVTFAAAKRKHEYVIAASIPWSVAGVTPRPGTKLRGDVGVVFGGATTVSVERIVRWVDRQTNVVNDVPTEAEFFPGRWGTFTLE